MLIMGRPTMPPGRLQAALGALGAAPLFTAVILPALWRAATDYGLDPTAVAAQSAHETGMGRFGGRITPAWHNTAGVKVQDLDAALAVLPPGTTTDHPLCHAMFASWDQGAEAHVQHLRAYAQVPFSRPVVDPRYDLVARTSAGRSPVEHLADLGGRWAPSPSYGQALEDLAARLLAAA